MSIDDEDAPVTALPAPIRETCCYSPHDVAELLGTSERYARDLDVPWFALGKGRRVMGSDLLRWLRKKAGGLR